MNAGEFVGDGQGGGSSASGREAGGSSAGGAGGAGGAGAGAGAGAGPGPGKGPVAAGTGAPPLSRYESQKRRDWNTFGQYLKNHRPPLALSRCSGAHVLEFLRYLDQFGKTKVHLPPCPFFGHPHPPAPCGCPLRQAWGSLDALIGRLRAAYEEHGGKPESNPFGARAVRMYLRDVREHQSKARGITYEKKKRKRPPQLLLQQNPNQPSQPLALPAPPQPLALPAPPKPPMAGPSMTMMHLPSNSLNPS